jgi:hypothetical protein
MFSARMTNEDGRILLKMFMVSLVVFWHFSVATERKHKKP